MAKRQALGRGLASLFPEDDVLDPSESSAAGIQEVETARIDPGPFQPRTAFDADSLKELATSIRDKGLLQPLVVRPAGERFQLICGERRFRAARIAQLDRVPVLVRDATDSEMLELALVENIQRDDLNALELAEGFRRLQKEFGYTQEEVAQRVGKDRTTVTNHLRLLNLPDEAKDAVARGLLSMGHARALLALDEAQLLEVLKLVLRKQLSVRETERLVKRAKQAATTPPAGRGTSEPVEEDVALRDMVNRLQRRFQTQVRIRRTKNGGGEIRIRYYSREELIRILELMPVE